MTSKRSHQKPVPDAASLEDSKFEFDKWLGEYNYSIDPVADRTNDRRETSTPAIEGFDFDTWLGIDDPRSADSNPTETDTEDVFYFSSIWTHYISQIHPVKGATYILFVTLALLALLSATGYIPPLGPTTGF